MPKKRSVVKIWKQELHVEENPEGLQPSEAIVNNKAGKKLEAAIVLNIAVLFCKRYGCIYA